MGGWLDALRRGGLHDSSIFGIALGVVFIALLGFAMPRERRGELRIPVLLLIAFAVLAIVRAMIPQGYEGEKTLRVFSLFVILACIGRSLFVLVVDWVLAIRLKKQLPRIVRDMLHVLLYVVIALYSLRKLGVEPGSLLTTSALLTAVLGLSLQETLGNLFAGLSMQAQQPFEVGDWIQYDNEPTHIGRVIEINWRATKVLTNDLVEIIVPNGALAKASILNFTQPTRVSRRTIRVQAPYEAPPREVMETLLDAVRGTRGVLREPAPVALLASFGDSGMEYWLQFYIDDFQQRNPIDSAVRTHVWYALERRGLHVPYPIRDVRVRQSSPDADRAKVDARRAEIERRLAAVDFLSVLPPDAIRQLAERVEVRRYTRDDVIIQQGKSGDELFLVDRGEVRVSANVGGKEVEVARLGPGKFFGEMSLMTGEARAATVHATDECELIVVGHDEFHDVLAAAPELAEQISDVLLARQAELQASADAASRRDPTAPRMVLLAKIKEFFSL